MEVRDQKEMVIITLFDHFAQVTNELNMLLPPMFTG